MRHISCDLCGKTLSPSDEPRYLLRLEGFAISGDEPPASDSEADSVDAMDELLTEQVAFEAVEEDGTECDDAPINAKKEYDLCRGCYSKMLTDPLGLETRHAPRFSRN